MIRVLTFNTQLRSWMMELGGFPPSLPPVYTAPDRAAIIADNILASPHDYDILCLNEVFDEDARDVLSSRLEGKYPYQVTKADLMYTRIVRPGLLNDISNTVFDLAFEPLLNVATLFALKLEDSGLFFASRWPFDLLPVPQAIVDAIGAPEAAELFPDGLLAVDFTTYGDCTGGFMADCRASKGVLWARVRKDDYTAVDVFATHTQADSEKVEENKAERRNQLAQAWVFICNRTGGPPFPNPTLFLGDFNVPSGLAENTGDAAEWRSLFTKPGEPLTDHLHDLWGTYQCRGGSTGLTDPGLSADVAYPPPRQRLDIVAADVGADLVPQHLYIDEGVWTPPPGLDDISYLSDHWPLGIDLGRRHDFASPPEAQRVDDDEINFISDNVLLGPGETMWFRYDVMGAYEFRVIAQDPEVYFEIYLGDDLSHPRDTFRKEKHPDYGDRYVLVAPFFVKVGCRNRRHEFYFELRSHRHTGLSPQDPLYLIPGVPYPESFPPGSPMNSDEFSTPWDDTDTKWFLLLTPRVSIDSMPVSLQIKATSKVRLLVAERDAVSGAVLGQIAEESTDTEARIDWEARPDDGFYVCVQRLEPGFPAAPFTLTAELGVTLLFGGELGKPTLICTEETGGWGADDISLRMKSDSGWSRTVSNDEIGDFEDDAVRALGQWIDPIVAYRDTFQFSVVEEDDIDSDDVGTVDIPAFPALKDWDRLTVVHSRLDGSLDASIRIEVDDGVYTLNCRIGRWNETI